MTPNIITIRAGTNRTVKFTMPADFAMAGKTFELVIQWPGGRRVYTEGGGLTRSGQNVTWLHSLADSRAFPEGLIAIGELQWTEGPLQDSDSFYLNVLPGVSND